MAKLNSQASGAGPGCAMRQCRTVWLMLFFLATTGSFAQKVHVQFDKRVDFSKFKTYAWLQSKHPAEGVWAQQVVADIDRQLTQKGLRRVEQDAGADLEVVYNAGIKERTMVQGYDYGYVLTEYLYREIYGPLWFWPRGSGSWSSEVEKHGNLVIDLVDASTRDMVWRGVATDTLTSQTNRNVCKLNKAIKKMFKRYPPKS